MSDDVQTKIRRAFGFSVRIAELNEDEIRSMGPEKLHELITGTLQEPPAVPLVVIIRRAK